MGDCDSTVEMHSVCCEDCSAQSATDAQTVTAQSLRFGYYMHLRTQRAETPMANMAEELAVGEPRKDVDLEHQ